MIAASLFVFLSAISSGFAFWKRPEICSNIDISRFSLPDVFFDDLLGRYKTKIWYTHLKISDTNSLQDDSKIFWERDDGNNSLREFFVGISLDTKRECATSNFRDTHKIKYRPCFISRNLDSGEPNPTGEYVFAFLDRKKTALLLFECLSFDKKTQICKSVEALAFTIRKYLLLGERELFIKALEDFGTDLSKSVLKNQLPTTNDCEVPEIVRIERRRMLRKRKGEEANEESDDKKKKETDMKNYD